jgi:hypothetical protein
VLGKEGWWWRRGDTCAVAPLLPEAVVALRLAVSSKCECVSISCVSVYDLFISQLVPQHVHW